MNGPSKHCVGDEIDTVHSIMQGYILAVIANIKEGNISNALRNLESVNSQLTGLAATDRILLNIISMGFVR